MDEQGKDEIAGNWEEWQLIGCGPPVVTLTPEFFDCP